MRSPVPLLLLAACASYGPRTVSRDRFDYGAAVGSSWNHELLSNIVRLRYLDMPVFLDVQQILAGYTVEGRLAAGWADEGLSPGWTFGGSGKYTDRPTITYRPRAGSVFAKNIMTPIEPRAILYLIQAGYSAGFVLPLCVSSMNNLRNGSGTLTGAKATDPRFARLVELFAQVQRSGGLGLRIQKSADDPRGAVLLVVGNPDATGENKKALAEIAELLGIDPDLGVYNVEYSTRAGGRDRISIQTRSVLQIMFEMATQIDAPADHLAKGYVLPGVAHEDVMRLITVKTGGDPGGDAFVKVKYHGHWLWIGNDDLESKRTFTFLNLLSAFVESAQPELPTLLTVPG